jgi:2Fe-2S ferredoxin
LIDTFGMPRITLIDQQGRPHNVVAEPGQTVLQVVRSLGLDGLDAECGGNCSCATCHVHVERAGENPFCPPSGEEDAMIDCAFARRPDSRLACQLRLETGHAGVHIRIAARHK